MWVRGNRGRGCGGEESRGTKGGGVEGRESRGGNRGEGIEGGGGGGGGCGVWLGGGGTEEPASYPGLQIAGERPGIHCLRMRLI